MKIIKFETYKIFKDWLHQVNWKEFLKIMVIPIIALTLYEIAPTNNSSDVFGLGFIYITILIFALILLLNSFISFFIIRINKDKNLNNKQKRKLKLEKIKYNKKSYLNGKEKSRRNL